MSEIKEIEIEDALEPVSIQTTEEILWQMKNCVCKIFIKGNEGTGFFVKIPYQNGLLSILISNNHVLDENSIKNDNIITLSINNEFKQIKMAPERKRYTNIELDITIIEIKENEDGIKEFLNLDRQIINYLKKQNNIDIFKDIYTNKSIYLLYYRKEIYTSYGLLSEIQGNTILHKCNSVRGSSGSPIILLKDRTVIGVHHGGQKYDNKFNFGTLKIQPII